MIKIRKELLECSDSDAVFVHKQTITKNEYQTHPILQMKFKRDSLRRQLACFAAPISLKKTYIPIIPTDLSSLLPRQQVNSGHLPAS